MTAHNTAAVILAAGLGTRMKSSLPKTMHTVAGRPMINHLLSTVEETGAEVIVTVIGEEMDIVRDAVKPYPTAIQKDRLGTAHAVLPARDQLEDFDGDVFILYGDTPLITIETLYDMLQARRSRIDPAVVVLGFTPADPGAYGRLIMNGRGGLEKIVEAKDATEEELAVDLCNSGVMCVDGKRLFAYLDKVDNNNAKGEYYLTDIVQIAREEGRACAVVEGSEDELIGVNSRFELAEVESILQNRLRTEALERGVTMRDPMSVYMNWDTKIAPDVTLGANIVFGPGVEIETGVEIRDFCHIEGAHVKTGTTVGPFARLRPGAEIGPNAHIGNFVEIKKAVVDDGAKVNHLTYIGDAHIGPKANIGAGTITCNYDGYFKSLTEIGAGAFIGSNTSLVAPVKVGDGAVVGAGSVVTKEIPADALGVTRAPQKNLDGWGKKHHETKAAEKAALKDKK